MNPSPPVCLHKDFMQTLVNMCSLTGDQMQVSLLYMTTIKKSLGVRAVMRAESIITAGAA